MCGQAKRGGDGGLYVSRGGSKLAWALDRFAVDPAEMTCADLGANVGGFTDCLIRRGAVRVYAVDTGYGVLDYGLRRDDRVVVMERVNALHVELGAIFDLVVIDVGWTRQRRILPKARELIRSSGRIVSLIKPQYEAPRDWVKAGKVTPQQARMIAAELIDQIPRWGLSVVDWDECAVGRKDGNREFFVCCGLSTG